jgi:hypothetical protein
MPATDPTPPPNHPWFRAKTYGWGWTPITWEGWAVQLGHVAACIGWVAYLLKDGDMPFDARRAILDLLPIVALTAVLIVICWLKGERPRWRWGK